MVHKHNLHKCAIAVNGCKKDISDRCRRGYSCTETINETYVDELTDRVVYQHWHCDDLRVVPYDLQMMMVGGPVEKMCFFQMAPTPPLSISICSTRCQYNILKVWLKKNDHILICGAAKVHIFLH